MISISNDNEFIYELLEKKEQLVKNFSLDKVIAFDDENDFHIVIYTAANRNFTLFTANNSLQNINILSGMMDVIREYPDLILYTSSVEQAVRLVENRVFSNNNSHFYFDAH